MSVKSHCDDRRDVPFRNRENSSGPLSSHRTHLQYTQYIYDGTLSIKFNRLASDLHLSCISTLGFVQTATHLKSDTSWETTFVLCKVRSRTKHTRIYIPSVTTCYIYVSTFRSLLGTRRWNQCCLIQHPAINPSFVSVDAVEYSLANGLFYLEIKCSLSSVSSVADQLRSDEITKNGEIHYIYIWLATWNTVV